MELDDLKAAWQTMDQRLDAQAALNLELLRDAMLGRARRGLRPLVWGHALQLVAGAMIVAWAASFWTQHRHVPHLLAAGLLVHAAGLSMIVLAGVVLVLNARIDYSAPVLSIQRQLAHLRRVYVRGGLAVGLPWWVLWLPFSMVFLKSAYGADLYANAPALVWSSAAVGLAGLLATWVLYRWSRGRPKLARRLADSAAGRSLSSAQECLDELARFERE